MTDARVDVIVVGSGASAVHAAYPLVEAGLAVRMLDVGHRDTTYAAAIPDGPFSQLRRTDPDQHRYLLGEHFEGIGWGHVGAGAQLTPPRQYVCRDADRLQPIASDTFFPLHSLAEGGLAQAWGAGSPAFAAPDLTGFPIQHTDLQPHYDRVADRIGVSGAHDELSPFLGELAALQPPVAIDSNGESILTRYASPRHRTAANRRGLYLGRPRLAVLSQPLRGRDANPLWDMDFWSDARRSVYRPRWTVDELRRFARFELATNRLVRAYTERPDGDVSIHAIRLDTGASEHHRARALVIAAGTLGTTRIVLRSSAPPGRRVPLVCNPHTYVAMLNANQLARAARDARHSLAQLCIVHAPDGSARPFTVGHLYSYRSLLLFRLMKDNPLPLRQSLEVMRLLSPSFAVLILQHADRPTPAKHCALDADDRLAIDYALSPAERAHNDRIEDAITGGLRRLRCVKLRTVRPGHAASTHFAGTLPMSAAGGELTTDRHGKLHGSRAVYVADGSVFPHLPSKGLTFTMMANADRIGCHVRSTFA